MGIEPRHGREEAGDGRHADHLGVGEGDEELAEGLGAPQGARADIALGDHRHVDERDLLVVVDAHHDLLVGFGSRDGEAAGQQVIACKPFSNLHYLAAMTKLFDFFAKNDFHNGSPWPRLLA